MTTATARHRAIHQPARPAARRRPAVPVDLRRAVRRAGLDPSSLDVQVEGTEITVRGHRSAPRLHDAISLRSQRPLGAIEHHVQLAQAATGHGITATYTDGVLTLTVPIAGPRARHVHDERSPAHVVHAVA